MLLIVIIAQALLEACLHLSPRLSSTSQRKCFSAGIAANQHFGTLSFHHDLSPPPVYCGRE